MNSTTASIARTDPAVEYDIQRIRRDFPILSRQVNGKPLVYLDNAATSQKPQAVLDALSKYYTEENANIHRGVHHLSVKATEAYEAARVKVQQHINAEMPEEIVFVRGATEAINLVAASYGRANIDEGDEIIISHMEHHSNIVPWQLLCEQVGAKLRVAPINDRGELLVDEYKKLFTDRTKMVAMVHVSNSLGTINPAKKIVRLAHDHNVPVLFDGAQAMPHMQVDVQALDCDFYAIAGHKMFGPTGIGALYGKFDLLDAMPPYQGGGEMILSVSFDKTTYNRLPHKFEAGTPNIAGAIGLGAGVDYLNRIGLKNISTWERELLEHGTSMLEDISQVRIIGQAKEKTAVFSFVIDGVHPHDVGTVFDQHGIAVRTGHHCTQPVMERFDIPATVRASLAFYNTKEELDSLGEAIHSVVEMFS